MSLENILKKCGNCAKTATDRPLYTRHKTEEETHGFATNVKKRQNVLQRLKLLS